MPAVPQLLPPTDFNFASRVTYPCLYCDFVAAGASEIAARSAMEAHARYINAHADRATDDHFEEIRIDALIGHAF